MIIFVILVFAGSGIISACIMKSALKQKKSCACKDCRSCGSDGLCYHSNPIVDENHMCISYTAYARTRED